MSLCPQARAAQQWLDAVTFGKALNHFVQLERQDGLLALSRKELHNPGLLLCSVLGKAFTWNGRDRPRGSSVAVMLRQPQPLSKAEQAKLKLESNGTSKAKTKCLALVHSALESDLAESDIAVGFLEVASADEGLSSVEGAVWVDLLVGHTQAEAIQGPPPPPPCVCYDADESSGCDFWGPA